MMLSAPNPPKMPFMISNHCIAVPEFIQPNELSKFPWLTLAMKLSQVGFANSRLKLAAQKLKISLRIKHPVTHGNITRLCACIKAKLFPILPVTCSDCAVFVLTPSRKLNFVLT